MIDPNQQTDAMETARLLAAKTLEGLRDPIRADGNAINNMYRLLVNYRSHGFFGCVNQAQMTEESPVTSLMALSDQNLDDVRQSLDETFGNIFRGEDVGAVTGRLKGVLRAVAYPATGERADPEELVFAERFFSVFANKLEVKGRTL